MTDGTGNVYGLIEREPSSGRFIGKIIGFPHIEFEGDSLTDVETKLRKAVEEYLKSGVLVLETQFVALIQLNAGLGSAEPTQALRPEGRSPHDES